MRIGLIGSENYHAQAYGKALNVDQRFPGSSITHLWGESEESATKIAGEYQIPTIVKDAKEMLGEVDAIIIDTRDGANHVKMVTPFLGHLPRIFIDKPLAADVEEAEAFLQAAEAAGTQIHCHSVIRLQQSFAKFLEDVKAIEPLTHLTLCTPSQIDSQYSGVFFYVVHAVECLCEYLNKLPVRARLERFATGALVTLDYADGPLVTINCQPGNYSYNIAAVGATQSLLAPIVTDEDIYRTGVDRIMSFLTGEMEPLSQERLLMPVRILAAIEKSKAHGDWEAVPGAE